MNDMQADKEWVDLIKTTLDNYQEDYEPGAWERFSAKQKRRRNMVYLRWSTGLAASLLIGWFAASWLFNAQPSVYQNQVITNTNSEIIPDNLNTTDTILNVPVKAGMKKVKSGVHFTTNQVDEKSYLAQTNNSKSHLTSASDTNRQISDSNQQSGFTSNKSEANHLVAADSQVTESNSILIAEKNNEVIINSQDEKPVKVLNQAEVDSALKAYTQPLVADNSDNSEEKSERKVRFGVNVSPGVNATQTAAAMNYGGGVNTDVSLFANVQLSTGLQIEQQNITTEVGTEGMPATDVHAELLTLDMPVNITWRFYSGKSHSYYVSGGVSSMAYLDQKYENTSYEFKLRENTVGDAATYQMTEEKNTTETQLQPFETFDFAGRVNIAFGLEQKLTPKLFLHVEPYVKIPVGGLGAEKMRFTTSGIMCKVSF